MRVEGEEELQQMLKISGMSMRQFNKHLQSNAILMGKNNQVIDQFTGKQLKLGNVMRQGMYQQRRFKMEWLSIMFAGMALDRAFGGLIRTQLQLFGVTDMMSGMWTTVLLPIMELITPAIYRMIEVLMNLPEGAKMAIGVFVLFGAVLGSFMAVIGQVFLGVMGFKLMLGPGGLSGVVKSLTVFIVGLGSTILIVFAIIAAVAVGIYLAWKTNFMNIRKTIKSWVAALKQHFNGIIGVIKGVLNIVKGIITGDFELVRKGIVQLFKGIWNFLIGGFKLAFYAIVIVIKGSLKIIYNIIKVIIDAVLWIADKAAKLVGGGGVQWRMPSFQTGGVVTQTGPALLHRGERVVPKGRTGTGEITFSPTVYITSTINNDMDIRLLANKLNEYWVKDFERISQTRGA